VTRATIVIPCFNEEHRLDGGAVAELLADPRLDVIFVDDGSRDGTARRLAALCAAHPGRARAISLPENAGKAEAVRAGLRAALDAGASVVGYLDADFATPPSEMSRLLDELDRTGAAAVLGSRIAYLGADIARHALRHYLGRVFATAASITLDLVVYDTQCGSKLFRDGPALRHALGARFSSRWAFDVELLGRLLAGGPGAPPLRDTDLLEVPLRVWRDVRGSKLGAAGMLKAGGDLLRLLVRVKLRGARGFFPDGR
jgi:glycosyltransferase involved in cell wall biosynthesis